MKGTTRIEAKIEAREWIIAAIQKYSVVPKKEAERELRKFIRRLQRDLKQLERARRTLASKKKSK